MKKAIEKQMTVMYLIDRLSGVESFH